MSQAKSWIYTTQILLNLYISIIDIKRKESFSLAEVMVEVNEREKHAPIISKTDILYIYHRFIEKRHNLQFLQSDFVFVLFFV